MKLSGNKKNGRFNANSDASGIASQPDCGRAASKEQPKTAGMKEKTPPRLLKIIIMVLVIILALLAVLYCLYKVSVKPPEIEPPDMTTSPAGGNAQVSGDPAEISTDRKSAYMYTFVVLGLDDGNNNTDTMMVVNFDAVNYTMHVVNIPRDTLVNVSWYTKKANSLYASGGGIDGAIDGLKKILGFEVDHYFIVDLDAFEALVDAVHGVDFDVPINMNYEDPGQNLYIHLNKGPQHLDGAEALQLVRFRHDYVTRDIGRIDMQQEFMIAMCQQVIEKQKQLNVKAIADIFKNYVETDLPTGNLIWFGLEFYKMDAENITFNTIPANTVDRVNGKSYVTIYLNDWLEMLNEKINPYKKDITTEQLSIYTRDAKGKLYVTDGNYAGSPTWGTSTASTSSGSSSNNASPSPNPSPSPSSSVNLDTSTSPSLSSSPNTSPSPNPSPSPSPSPSAIPGEADSFGTDITDG